MVPLHCQPVDVQVAVMAIPRIIEETMEILTDRERIVLCAYFGLDPREFPVTLDEIARQLSLSRERVRQIKNMALWRLRRPWRLERLRSYADIYFSFCAGDEI